MKPAELVIPPVAPAEVREGVAERRLLVQLQQVLERAFLEIGIANVGVNRSEPVQRPPFGRRDAHAPSCRAVASDFDVDLIFRWLGERHPELAAQRRSFRRGE